MKPQNKQILDKIAILNGNGATQEKANKSDFDSHLAEFTAFKNQMPKMFCGNNTFNGITGVTISHNAEISNYIVQITPVSSDPTGAIGVYWVENKTANSFMVKNTGDIGFNFDWLLIKLAS